jgi:hypothetical protein
MINSFNGQVHLVLERLHWLLQLVVIFNHAGTPTNCCHLLLLHLFIDGHNNSMFDGVYWLPFHKYVDERKRTLHSICAQGTFIIITLVFALISS